jgi:hypothetical protein
MLAGPRLRGLNGRAAPLATYLVDLKDENVIR